MQHHTHFFLGILLSGLLGLSGTPGASAQNHHPEKEGYVPRMMEIKWAPTSLIFPSPVSVYQLGFEHHMPKSPQYSLYHEAGILNPFPYNTLDLLDGGPRLQAFFGCRIRSGFRYYFKPLRQRFNVFTTARYQWQFEKWSMSSWENAPGNNYQQYIRFTKRVNHNGLLFGIGIKGSRGRTRIMGSEWVIGAGFNARTVRTSNLPRSILDRLTNEDIFRFGDGYKVLDIEKDATAWVPSLLLTYRMRFRL